MDAEITWDLVMSEDMSFIEGCYRVKNGPWQVVTAFKRQGVLQVETHDVSWESGVTGINVVFSESATIDADVLLKIMSSHLGVEEWLEVRGPDSMVLR